MLLALIFQLAWAGEKVLFIGDSHSTGCFGRTLDEAFRRETAGVRTEATCGSGTASWLRSGGHSTRCGFLSCRGETSCTFANSGTSPGLAALLGSEKPQWTIVALGTNMLKADWGRTRNEVGRMVDLIRQAGSRCTWIGPPQASARYIAVSDYERFVLDLRAAVTAQGCAFVDSATKTDRRRLADQLHYPCREARDWANRVLTEF